MDEVIRKEIGSIKFGILSPEAIRKLSAMEITVPELYDQDGFPVEGGLMDPRLGVVDPGMRCRTCGSRVGTCPGHFGQIELAKPVVHIRFGRHIYYWLSATCHECGRLKIPEHKRKFYYKMFKVLEDEGTSRDKNELIKDIRKEAKEKETCPFCDVEQKKVKWERPTTYYVDGTKIMPSQVRERLEKIPDEDLELMGVDTLMARPEWTVLTVVITPPVTARPSITLETGERSEDDLTHKMVDIMRINTRLKENMASGAPAVIIEDFWELLQYHVTTMLDNQVSGVPPARHRAGRVLKGIVQRIKTKEGRFRRNLAGKRVNFSARTVISPDSRIGVNEVGVPTDIAKVLTVPEHVNETTVEWLREVVGNGSENVVGANYVIDNEGNRLRITDFNKENLCEKLEQGWIVERHLADGDVVLMNRQPTLHKMSIMGHIVRVLPGRSFRINPSVCPPYNADFDGDEMNMHVPQGEEARAESYDLLSVTQNIRSPRYGGLIVGGWKDQLSGSFLLTQEGTELDREEAMQLLNYAGVDIDLPKGNKFTGKEVFSFLLPDDFSIRFKSKSAKSGKLQESEEVVIKDGVLKKGVIDDRAIGAFGGIMLDRIIQEYGNEFAVDFMNKATNLVLGYLSIHQLSMGVDDLIVSDKVRDKINGMVKEAQSDVSELIKDFQEGKLKSWPGLDANETLETEIINKLNKVRDEVVDVVSKSLDLPNPAVIMAISGARGKLLNLGLISGIIGQQAISGGRPTRGYYSKRTFPHFPRKDVGVRSKGFISSSYATGLDPFEFFWVSASGREGLADTGVKTPKSGYMYRRLSNALQDLRVESDRTVRDASGTIVQFKYGEDGIDVRESDFGTVDFSRIVELIKK